MPDTLTDLLAEHNVATTALLANYWKYTAKNKNHWNRLCQERGSRDRDLFKDEVMSYFIDPAIQSEAENRLDYRMWLPLATRTRFFRQTVSDSIQQKGIQQVIILGCGFDTLSVRKSKYTRNFGVRFFEIDQAPILSCKADIYLKHDIDKNAVYIGLDYVQNDFIQALKAHDLDFSQPTLILWEGNTFYLEREHVIQLLQQFSNEFEQLILSFDYMHEEMNSQTPSLDRAAGEHSLDQTLTQFARRHSPFKAFFDPTELVSICEQIGIQCVAHKTAAQLAKDYDVDTAPYYTAETYSVVTFERLHSTDGNSLGP